MKIGIMDIDGHNYPNLADMIRAAMQDGVDLCEYCRDLRSCRDCIVDE